MPIRPENKARYPKDWPAISRRIRFERANNQCEFCGVQNYELGGRTKDGQWHKARITGCDRKLPEPGSHWWCDGPNGSHTLRIVKIILTVAHLDHVPENCDDDNLKALCQRCHNNYDAKMRREGIRRRAMAGQVDMFTGEGLRG